MSVSAHPEGDLDRDRLRQLAVSKLQAAGIHVDQKSRAHLNVIIGLSTIRSDNGVGRGYAHLSVSQVYLRTIPIASPMP